AIASGFGGIVSVIALSAFAPFLAQQSLRFGPPEYFALAVFGLTIISSLTGKSPVKGLLAGVFGILIATVGMDPISGYPRFTFGHPALLDGFALIPVLIGLFSASQAFNLMISSKLSNEEGIELSQIPTVAGKVVPKFKELLRLTPNMGRSSIIGTI